MSKLLGCLTFALALLASNVRAEAADLYFGIGVADGGVDVPNGPDRSLGTVNATLGLQLLGFLGLELELGAASDQTDSLLGEPLVSYQAAMLRLGHRWDRTGVYLLGGQARLEVDDSLNHTDAGLVFGAGLNLFGNETTALNVHVLDFDDGAFTTATIGFQYYFGGFR